MEDRKKANFLITRLIYESKLGLMLKMLSPELQEFINCTKKRLIQILNNLKIEAQTKGLQIQ